MKTQIKKQLWLLVGISLLSTALIFGQQDMKRHQGSLSFSAGYLNLDHSEFQMFLPNAFDDLSDHYALVGGSGYVMLGNLMLGASGQFIFGPTEKHGSREAEITGGMGFANMGYAVINQERLKIFPMVGIGGAGMEMKLTHQGDIDRGEILINPGSEMNLSVANFAFDFSAGLDFSPTWKVSENGKQGGGMNLGMRVGYILGVGNKDWTYGGGEVTDGPDFGMRSFYVKVLVGTSGFMTRKKMK